MKLRTTKLIFLNQIDVMMNTKYNDWMTDEEFKMRIVRQVAEMRTDIKHILARLPKEDLSGKIKFNRSLILVMLTSYLGLAIYLIQK